MKVLREDDQKTAVVGWGRFNPPTIGHNELVNTLADIASKNNADPLLYMSHKYQDKKDKDSRGYFKDPLKYEDKLYFAKKAFGDRVNVVESDAKTIIQVFQDLQARGYKNIIYVGGSDRIGGTGDITNAIEKYNGGPNSKGTILYNFDSINFVKAGKDRDEDSDDLVTSASASLARKYAIDGDLESFKQIVPLSGSDAEEMYDLVRAELGITENLNEATHSVVSDIRVYVPGEDEPRVYKLKDNNDIEMGSDRMYSSWKDIDRVKLVTDTGEYDAIIKPYSRGNQPHVGFITSNGVYHGVQGLQSKGFQSEKRMLASDSLNTVFNYIKTDMINRDTNGISGVELSDEPMEPLGENNRALISVNDLFTKEDAYAGFNGNEIGRNIADNVLNVNVTYNDGSQEQKEIYISNKYGPVYTPVNRGVNSFDINTIESWFFNDGTLLKQEEQLLTLWWNTKSSRNIVIANNGNGDIDNWYYKFSANKINVENLKNFIANQYATGYYLVHEDSNGKFTTKYIDDLTTEIREGTVDYIGVTLTQSMLCSNITINGQNTETDIRRKGSTNYSLLSKLTANNDVKRRGVEIHDLSNYKFKLGEA